MNWFEKALQSESRSRGLGFLMLAGGLLFAWLMLPVEEILSGKRFRFHPAVVIVSGCLSYYGLILIVTGRQASRYMITRHGQAQSVTQLRTTVIGILLVAGLYLTLFFGWKPIAAQFRKLTGVARPRPEFHENIPLQQSRAGRSAKATIHRAYEYSGYSYHDPETALYRLAIDVEISGASRGFDLDDVEIVDGSSSQNFGSFPDIYFLDSDGNLLKESDDSNAEPVRVLLIYAVPDTVQSVRLRYWGRDLVETPAQVEGSGPSVSRPDYADTADELRKRG